MTIYIIGEEGDVCECGHLYSYHCDLDKEDGTEAGCQIQGCDCKAVWKEDSP